MRRLWQHGARRGTGGRRSTCRLNVVQHVGEYIFGVLQPFRHLGVVRIESLIQRHYRSISQLINVGDQPRLGVKMDLSVVGKIHLNNLVGESEHYCMLRLHPLLHIDRTRLVVLFFPVVYLTPA